MFLLQSPHVYHDQSSRSAYPRQLLNGLDAPLDRGKVVDNRDGDDGIEAVATIREAQIIAHHGLVAPLGGDVHKIYAAIRANLEGLFVDSKVLAIPAS